MNNLYWWFAHNTLVAGMMILAVFGASWFFRHRPAVQHLLWLIVLVRFMLPPVIAWPWEITPMTIPGVSNPLAQLQRDSAASINQSSSQQNQPLQNDVRTGDQTQRKANAFPMDSQTSADTSAQSGGANATPVDSPRRAASPSHSRSSADLAGQVASSSRLGSSTEVDDLGEARSSTEYSIATKLAFSGLAVWLVGAVACLILQLRCIHRQARLLRGTSGPRSQPASKNVPAHLARQLADVAELMRIAPPDCVLSSQTKTPFVWCWGKPLLVWPASMQSEADVARASGVIAHEFAHLRRRDHWVAWLELSGGIIWWWNPLFWLARGRLRDQAEMACDAMAIEANPASRREYAELLLAFSTSGERKPLAPALSIGAGTKQGFEKRLAMIVSQRASSRFSYVGLLLTILVALVAVPHWSFLQADETQDEPATVEESSRIQDDDDEVDSTATVYETPKLYRDHWVIEDVVFLNGDQEIVTVSSQGFTTVRRWRVATQELLSEVQLAGDQHARSIRSETLTLSDDGTRVVGATDEYVGIWDAASGDLLKTLSIPKKDWAYDCVRCLDCSPDFSRIAAGLGTKYSRTTMVYDGYGIVWDTASGDVVSRSTHKHGYYFRDIELSPDGKWFGTCNEHGRGVCIWETETGKLVREAREDDQWESPDPELIKHNLINTLTFSPDGAILAFSGSFGIKLIDASTGELRLQIDAPYRYHSGNTGLRFSSSGGRIARVGAQGKDRPYSIPIWSTETGEQEIEIETSANVIDFSDDGRLLALGGSDFYEALAVLPLEPTGTRSVPEPTEYARIDRVEENTHRRGENAQEFVDRWNPVWGDARYGIQYGVALTTEDASFRIGERVRLAAFVRNISDVTKKIDLRPDMFWNLPRVTAADGSFVPLERRPLLGTVAHYRDTLEPGDVFGPLYLNFGVGDNPTPEHQNWFPYWSKPATGDFTLTHSIPLKQGRPDASRDETSADWMGETYSSGVVKFRIEEANPSPQADAHAPVPVVSEVANIHYVPPPAIAQTLEVPNDSWGPVVKGLQAAFVPSDVFGCSEKSMFINGALVVRNVGPTPVAFSETHELVQLDIRDAEGEQARMQPGIFTSLHLGRRAHDAMSIVRRTILAPGEQCVLDRTCELAAFLESPQTRTPTPIHTMDMSVQVRPGEYLATASFQLGLRSQHEWEEALSRRPPPIPQVPDMYERGKKVELPENEWHATLKTGVTRINLFGPEHLINESRKVRAYVEDNLRIRTRDGRFTFFQRDDDILRLYDQHAHHAVLAFQPARDFAFVTEGTGKQRALCLRTLIEISSQTVKLTDLPSGKVVAQFRPNEAGKLEPAS